MALTLSQRMGILSESPNVSELSSIWIDGNEITGYFTYTFVKAKTLNKSPVRSKGGQIKNINHYSFFITPRVQIMFNYLSLEAYQTIMRLIQSKNEFTVRLYDIEAGKMVTHKMYFSTEDYPELVLGYNKLRGIKNYTIELQGTNNDLSTFSVIYHLNPPSDVGISDVVVGTRNLVYGADIIIGENAHTSTYGDFSTQTFNNRYKFQTWSTNDGGTGFNYINRETYKLNETEDLHLYAIWKAGGSV